MWVQFLFTLLIYLLPIIIQKNSFLCYFHLQRDSKYDGNVQSNTGPKETNVAEDKANTNAEKVSIFLENQYFLNAIVYKHDNEFDTTLYIFS